MKKKESKRKLVFISHASVDNKGNYKVAEQLATILEANNYEVFCSSVPKKGISFGKRLFKTINAKIDNCNFFIAIITDNYLRSTYCLYELSIARYKGLTIIPIISNGLVERKCASLLDNEIVKLVLSSEKDGNRVHVKQLLETLELGNQSEEAINNLLSKISLIGSMGKPFIGMTKDEYDCVFAYCEKEGITKLTNGYVYNPQVMRQRIKTAQNVYLVSTTGAALLKSIEDVFIDALMAGVEINIIIPDRDSDFCNDVARAESLRDNFTEVITNQNRNRIESEFEAVHQYLNEVYCRAKSGGNPPKGKIRCYNSKTLLRQTIFLTVSKDNTAWGWITMTLPPIRTSDSPSIVISDNNANEGIVKYIIDHCKCLMYLAESEHEFREINGRTNALPFRGTKDCTNEAYWREKESFAKRYMQERSKRVGILIEVAAQHPLVDGIHPNEEFARRLDFAVNLFRTINNKETKIFVPGSRHVFCGVADDISLSQAGKDYLIARGIPENAILSEEMIIKYKGSDGVYNSADECFVASKIFKEGDYGTLYCICSPNQIMRKTFYYIDFGVIPLCYGVPSSNMYHEVVSEYFDSLRNAVYDDHNCQNVDSEVFINSRRERKPDLE